MMTLKIHYSSAKFVEIDIEETAQISELYTAFYTALAQHAPAQVDKFSHNYLFLLEGRWLELGQTLAEYNIKANQHLDTMSLHFTEEEPGPSLRHIPDEFVCQLSGSVFLEPMQLPSGLTAENELLSAWIGNKKKCPFTNASLTRKDIHPNADLLAKIQRFIQAYPQFEAIMNQARYRHQDINVDFESARAPTHPVRNTLFARSIVYPNGQIAVATSLANRDRAIFTIIDNKHRLLVPVSSNSQTGNGQIIHGVMMQRYILSYHSAVQIFQCSADIAFIVLATAYYALAVELNAKRMSAPGVDTIPPTVQQSGLSPSSPHVQLNTFQSSPMARTLHTLQRAGVTEELIMTHWKPHASSSKMWTAIHELTLFYFAGHSLSHSLPLDNRPTLIQGLQEMAELNPVQLVSLKNLYLKGLRGAHLRTWRDHNQTNDFSSGHATALCHFMNKREMSAEEAINKIAGLSSDAANNLVYEDCLAYETELHTSEYRK